MRPRTAVDESNQQAIGSALTGLGGAAKSVCIDGPRRGQSCTQNSDCLAIASRRGWCRRVVTYSPAFSTRDACTDFADVVVPLRQKAGRLRKGVKTIGVQTMPSLDPLTGKRRIADSNFLKLTCWPHP
ncbi:MAG: hypothetical protein HY270_04650 [Deltaproteobacteria bacterium]|nr:hypothetical protein [Deltaproteobacteria bacterium]